MTHTAAALLEIATVVFAISSMLSAGFGHTFAEVVGPLTHLGSVARALLANFVLVPALAWGVLRIVPLAESLEVGMMLVAVAAGAPFVIKLSRAAAADVALTASLLLLLLPATVVYMPLVVPLLLPGAGVPVGAIAMPLAVTMLIPLAGGLLLRERRADWATRLQPVMTHLSTVALVVLMASALVANADLIAHIGWRALVAAATIITGAFVLGYLLGGRDPDDREVLGLGTAQRNISAAAVVATQAVGDPGTVSMIVVSSLEGLAILFPIARVLYRREQSR